MTQHESSPSDPTTEAASTDQAEQAPSSTEAATRPARPDAPASQRPDTPGDEGASDEQASPETSPRPKPLPTPAPAPIANDDEHAAAAEPDVPVRDEEQPAFFGAFGQTEQPETSQPTTDQQASESDPPEVRSPEAIEGFEWAPHTPREPTPDEPDLTQAEPLSQHLEAEPTDAEAQVEMLVDREGPMDPRPEQNQATGDVAEASTFGTRPDVPRTASSDAEPDADAPNLTQEPQAGDAEPPEPTATSAAIATESADTAAGVEADSDVEASTEAAPPKEVEDADQASPVDHDDEDSEEEVIEEIIEEVEIDEDGNEVVVRRAPASEAVDDPVGAETEELEEVETEEGEADDKVEAAVASSNQPDSVAEASDASGGVTTEVDQDEADAEPDGDHEQDDRSEEPRDPDTAIAALSAAGASPADFERPDMPSPLSDHAPTRPNRPRPRPRRKTANDTMLEGAIPVLLTIGVLCALVAGWAMMLLSGQEGVPFAERENAETMAQLMLVSCGPLALILIGSGVYSIMSVLKRRRQEA